MSVRLSNKKKSFLARLFFREKSPGIVITDVAIGDVVIVVDVVKNSNLGYNFKDIEANLLNLHTLVNHHKVYKLTEGHNSATKAF